jgi:hypothetical protein
LWLFLAGRQNAAGFELELEAAFKFILWLALPEQPDLLESNKSSSVLAGFD